MKSLFKYLPASTIIILGVFWVFKDYAALKILTADASAYLNIAENIITGRGFVISFNLYQSFSSLYYPIWPYIQPLYPLFCSLFISGGIERVIQANIVLLGINAALLFCLLQILMPTKWNVIFIVWLIFSFNFFICATLPWTEEFHLALFLISFILFLKYAQNRSVLGWLGFLNGVLMLVRFAHIYHVAAYVAVLALWPGRGKDKLKNIMYFAGGFMVFFAAYQAFNWIAYHQLYPQYSQAATNYSKARFTHLPVYHEGGIGIDSPWKAIFNPQYFYSHLLSLFQRLSLFAVLILFFPRISAAGRSKEQEFFVFNCVCQTAFVIFGYALSFAWYPPAFFETLRYCLIPFILTALAGWYCLYQLLIKSSHRWVKGVVGACLIGVAVFGMQKFAKKYQNDMLHPRETDPYYQELFECYRWIDQNLPQDILVASNDDQNGYLMHRPFISTPVGRSFTCENLQRYQHIYAPDYYLLSASVSNECFTAIPSTKVFSTHDFRILKVLKD
jgi:hypothetical protein